MHFYLNARMYSVSEPTRRAWEKLFNWVIRQARVPSAEWLAHEPPLLISEMWKRNDLGCAMMCGLPAARRQPAPILLASVIPSLARYQSQSIYMSDLVVRRDSPYEKLEDTYGGIAGYTVPDSQSGYFAFRYRLLNDQRRIGRLYRSAVGGLLNARGIIAALQRGEIDVGPLDGYVFDLIKATEPEFARDVRIIETTPPTPLPPIVSTAPLDVDQVSRLRDAFLAAGGSPDLREERRTLLIQSFALPDLSQFKPLAAQASEIEAAAPPWPI